jgi:hypothetical protein
MTRSESPLARWRRRRGRFVGLALTAMLALLAAPLRAALRGGCDLCPPDCPMHASARAAASDAHRDAPPMRCHNAGHTRREGDLARGHRLSRPPCGSHAALAGLELAPMLADGPLPWRVALQVAPTPQDHRLASGRSADPPDPPPPRAHA